MSLSFSPDTPLETRLASIMHNTWLYTHERDEIREALDAGTGSEQMFQTMYGRIRHRLLAWENAR